jgi:hypothetical protein
MDEQQHHFDQAVAEPAIKYSKEKMSITKIDKFRTISLSPKYQQHTHIPFGSPLK